MTRITKFYHLSEGHGYWDRLTDWCVAQFGSPGPDGRWNYSTKVITMDFYFQDDRDAEFFVLKWM